MRIIVLKFKFAKSTSFALMSSAILLSCGQPAKTESESSQRPSTGTCMSDQMVWACDGAGCRCVWTGVAPESAVGNMLIDMAAGGFAGPLKSLLNRMGAKAIPVAVDASRRFGGVLIARSGEGFARWQSRVTSAAVQKQLSIVDDEMVKAIVKYGQNYTGYSSPVISVEDLGVISYAKRPWNPLKSISLGTAREATKKLGREIALLRAGGKNYLVVGTERSVSMQPQIRGSATKIIFHTHPEFGSALDAFAVQASAADESLIIALKQSKSFVIHGSEGITMFFATAP